MTREQLEHIIRSASTISNDYEIVVGSQSILGEFPHAPKPLLHSMEADIYPLNQQSKSDLIDGTLGEESYFHKTYGYYAQGVGPETSLLLSDLKNRLIPIRLSESVGYCLDVYDLAIAKLVANREKDHQFIAHLFHFGLIEQEKLTKFAEQLITENKTKAELNHVLSSIKRRKAESEMITSHTSKRKF